jgi:hypothetical protein
VYTAIGPIRGQSNLGRNGLEWIGRGRKARETEYGNSGPYRDVFKGRVNGRDKQNQKKKKKKKQNMEAGADERVGRESRLNYMAVGGRKEA